MIARMMAVPIPTETPVPVGQQPRALIIARDGSEYLVYYRADARTMLDQVHIVSGAMPTSLTVPPYKGWGIARVNEPASEVQQAAWELRSELRMNGRKSKYAIVPAVPPVGHNDVDFRGIIVGPDGNLMVDPDYVPDGTPLNPPLLEPTWTYQVIEG